MSVLILAVIVAIFDQGIKYYVQSNISLGMSIPVITDIFHITYILNPGAAFGVLAYQTKFFVFVTIAMLVALVYCYRYIATEHRLCRFGVGLLAGGAVGNVIDRLKTGYVVDYIDFRIWPVFNSADVAIMLGTGCIIYTLLYMPSKPSTRPPDS